LNRTFFTPDSNDVKVMWITQLVPKLLNFKIDIFRRDFMTVHN